MTVPTMFLTELYEDWSVAEKVPSGKLLMTLVDDRDNVNRNLLGIAVLTNEDAKKQAEEWGMEYGRIDILINKVIDNKDSP